MDSTLGKIIAALLVLLAVFAVVVTGAQALSRHNDNALVSGITTLSTHIQGDYANNTAGYGTLSNATVIAAGEAPNDLVQNGALVDPWGNPMTVGPLSGNAHGFKIQFGPVPVRDCASTLPKMNGANGIQVGSNNTPMTPPYDAATLTSACSATASNNTITLMYGGVEIVQHDYMPGTVLATSGAGTNSTFWIYPSNRLYAVAVNPNRGGYVNAQWKITNPTASPMQVNIIGQLTYTYPSGSYVLQYPTLANAYINGQATQASVNNSPPPYGGAYGYAQYTITVPPGSSTISFAYQNPFNAFNTNAYDFYLLSQGALSAQSIQGGQVTFTSSAP